MKKKFLALVLTLAMVLSLVPATALATGATQEGNNQGPVEVTGSDNDKNLTMKKTVMPNKDGTYTVRLESYATGEVKTTTTTESLDIVLLLDVSGSMNDSFTESNERYQAVYELSNGSVYYVRDKSNKYKKVTYCPTCAQWTNNCKNRLIGHRKGTAFTPKTSESDTTGTQFYEKVYTPAQSKMEALKRAVNGFIDNIAQNSPESKASIVKFAGEQSDAVGDSKYREGWYDYNYTQIVQDLTQVNPSGAEQLKQAVSNLEAAGATSSDYGLEKAKAVLDSESATQKKVIILFTDGEPNHDSGFDYEVATNAVNTAKTLKQDKTTIYTVGVFKNPSDDINQYMSSVSSNYPNATAQYIPGDWWENDTWRVIDGDSDSGTYYKTADSAGELINAFQTISSEVSSTNLNGSAVVVDKVPSNFKAPANAKDVTLKVADYQKGNKFGEETPEPEGVTATVKDGTVSVTGFDFSKNWCGLDKNKKAHGQKLIIEFTISRTNYGGTQPTNAGAYIKANADSTDQIISLKDPEVPVTVQLPEGSDPYTDTKVYDGAGFDIKNEISEIIAGLVPVDGIKNKFIDLTYKIKDSSGKTVGTYMILAGQTTGTWSDNTEIKTGPDVGEYKYTITVTGQDINTKQPNNKDSKECTATFKITKKDVTFTGESDTVTWNGEEKTITGITATGLLAGHTYSGLTYAATGIAPNDYTGNFSGDLVISDKDRNDVTDNYKVTKTPGTLTITDSTSTATVTFKIVGGTWSDDNTAKDKTVQVTLTNGKGSLAEVDIPTGVADADHQGDGTWGPATPEAGTEITQDGNKVFTLTFQKKEEQKPADPVKLDVSRSKTAKPLDTSTWTSNVTLSLPSAEYEPVIDVVFILDDTYAGNGIFKDAATALLNELSEKKNLDVNVGIVNFDAVARDWVAATTNSQYSGLVSLKNTEGLTALQSAIDTKLDKNNDGQTKKIGATNIEWPLEMAQNMLASGKGTEKYAILFSDMYGYVYRGDLIIDGQTYENVPLSKRLYAGESKFYQGSLSMGTKYQSFADVYAHRNDQENQTIDGFFRDTSWDDYWNIYSGYTQAPTNPVTKGSEDPFGVSGGYSGFEKSTCLVYDRLLQMKQAGINISIVNNDFAPGTVDEVGYIHSIKNEMLNVLKEKGISVIQTQKDVTAGDMTNVFDTLKDQLIQVVSAGSTVTDKIGTNFDFVGLNTMSLKIGDDTIPGVIDEATNTITFKHADKNDAHVVAYDSDTNSFKWTINEDVTKDARVQLTYTVKLKTPQTLAGTYGVEDLNGDGKVDRTDTTYTDTDALYTNESATMVPKDSNGNTGEELTFPKPSVSYTIKGSSGGHGGNGGGTVTIPDDVPTGLNGKDHYAYVVGYPDGMVYPQKNITRAEVATIFFRLLKDETREANMTKSNSYNDMKDGAWYTCAVSTLSKMGIIKGYEDGSFKPDASISRAEFAAIAARFDPDGDKTPATFSDVSSHWAKDEISIAANHGWIKGYEDGSFKPDQKITRAETMTLVNRVLKRLPETKDDLHKDMKTWPDNQNESAWFYLAVQEATNSHYQKLKKDGTHETWESMRETRDWAALEK